MTETIRKLTSARRSQVGLLAAGFGLLGAAIVFALTRHEGPGISTDSVNYLSAADSLWSTGTVKGFLAGDHLADFPPLYSVLLVPGEAFDAPLTGARIVGAVSFGLLVAAGAVGSSRIADGLVYPAAAAISVLVAYPVAGVSSFVWSDAPFAVCVAAFLLVSSRVGVSREAVVASGLLSGAATLTRYLGVTTIAIGLLAIWLWSERRRRDLLLFLVISTIGPFVWVARNLIVTSTLTGDRHPASEGLETAVRSTTSTIGTWLFTDRPLVGLAAAVLLGLASAPMVRRLPLSRLEAVTLPLCAVYVALVVASAATVSLDPIDDRFLAPLYVPLVWMAVGTSRRLVALGAERIGWWPSVAALTALAVVWAVAQGSRLPNLADEVNRSSLAYVPRWGDAEEQLARDVSPRLYTNAPDAVYLGTGSRVAFSPRKARYRSDEAVDELSPLRERLVTDGAAVLIWFDQLERPAVYTPEELAEHVRVRRLTKTSNAVLYAVCSARRVTEIC